MKFLDWWIEFSRGCPLDMTDIEMAKQAWEAGKQEALKREWVGLTDKEINELANDYLFKTLHEFARAAEAKLKEKNT